MYKLNKNSRSAKFYKWVWGTDVTTFKTMCPYFWKYVLTILFSPVILPGKLIIYLMPAKKQINKGFEYVSDSKLGTATGNAVNKVAELDKLWYVVGKLLKWLFFIVAGILVLVVIISMLMGFYAEPVNGLAIIGAFAVFVGLSLGVFYLFEEKNLGSKIAYPFKIFGNMVYSLYKNVCPIIKWD